MMAMAPALAGTMVTPHRSLVSRFLATLIVLLAALPLLALARPAAAADAPVVAAAATLRFAMAELAAGFKQQTGREVRLVYGSSGVFHQQIMAGAPFQLFLSADEDYALSLARAGKTAGKGTLYAVGRIVLVAPKNSELVVDSNLDGLRTALARGDLRRFAIANPEHAPYGMRAEEALRHAGLWKPIEPRLVLGENVAQALQFATVGGADGGIVALSLVRSPTFKGMGRYALIPAGWHAPLRQRMVLMKGAGETARLFYAWLQTPAARTILARYGYGAPGETR